MSHYNLVGICRNIEKKSNNTVRFFHDNGFRNGGGLPRGILTNFADSRNNRPAKGEVEVELPDLCEVIL
ncbi:MAG: hypothetical protein AB1798_17120, partial [Spirochaetota bacterium]